MSLPLRNLFLVLTWAFICPVSNLFATSPPVQFTKVNAGNYIDAGEPVLIPSLGAIGKVTSLYNDSGDLIYVFRSENLGNIMGRFSASKKWELWGQAGWTREPGAIPVSISHINTVYQDIRLFRDPNLLNGFLGAVHVGLRLGANQFDHHGYYSGLKFDGVGFTQWKEGATYDEFYTKHIASDWNLRGMDFQFDGLDLGILVSFSGSSSEPILHSAKYALYSHTDPRQSWSGLQDILPPSSSIIYSSPRLTRIGSGNNYLLTYRAIGGGLPGHLDLKAAMLTVDLERGSVWKWWNGSSWKVGEGNSYTGIGQVGFHQQTQIEAAEGMISIIVSDGIKLSEIVYNSINQSFSPPCLITSPGEQIARYILERDANGTLWLVIGNSQGINIRKKAAGAVTWSSPEMVYTGSTLTLPVGINFFGSNADPIIFVTEEVGGYKTRLAALAPVSGHFSAEQPMAFQGTAANAMPLISNQIEFKKEVENWQENLSYRNAIQQPGPIGLDSGGNLFATRYGLTSLIFHPQTSQAPEHNFAWGNYWDHFRLPGGVAVNDSRREVYVTSSVTGDSGASLGSFGQLQRWDFDMRGLNVGYNTSPFSSMPSGFDTIYRPYIFSDSFSWPNDVAYDAVRDRVYVVNSLEHCIKVYKPTDDTSWFAKAGLFETSIATANLAAVRNIVGALISNGMLVPVPGDPNKLKWGTAHFRDIIVPYVKSLSYFWQISSNGDHVDVLRNINNHYKSRFGKLVPQGVLGTYGFGPGQFKFPVAVDTDAAGNLYVVDGDNHRVHRWNWNGVTHTFNRIWGNLGKGNGQFIYPADLAIDRAGGRVFVTDPMQKRVQVFDLSGNFKYLWNAYYDGGYQIKFDRLNGIAIDSSRRLLHLGANNSVISFMIRAPAQEKYFNQAYNVEH